MIPYKLLVCGVVVRHRRIRFVPAEARTGSRFPSASSRRADFWFRSKKIRRRNKVYLCRIFDLFQRVQCPKLLSFSPENVAMQRECKAFARRSTVNSRTRPPLILRSPAVVFSVEGKTLPQLEQRFEASPLRQGFDWIDPGCATRGEIAGNKCHQA